MAAAAAWAGLLKAEVVGVRARDAALALLLAWLIQVVAFAALARALGRGGNATRAWVAGMAARVGSLLLAFPAMLLDLVPRGAAIAFGLGLTMLIILEAIWLATVGTTDAVSNDR